MGFGKRLPTVEVGGHRFTLRPVTIEKLRRLGSDLVEFRSLQRSGDGFRAAWKLREILHYVLLDETRGSGIFVDDEAFEEWFVRLDVVGAAEIVIHRVLEAAAAGDRSHQRRVSREALKIMREMGLG